MSKKWGTVVYLVNSLDGNVYTSCLYVKSLCMILISDVVKVVVDGDKYLIYGKEVVGLIYSFKWDDSNS